MKAKARKSFADCIRPLCKRERFRNLLICSECAEQLVAQLSGKDAR